MVRMTKYDILRIVASFSIVLLHVSASYWSVVDVQSGEFAVMTIYNSVTRFAVPIFFMLSGLFLVSPDREHVAVDALKGNSKPGPGGSVHSVPYTNH